MILVVAGTRSPQDPERVRTILAHYGKNTISRLYHGGQRGVDSIAGAFAQERGWDVVVVPYAGELAKQGGPVRNAEMLCQAVRHSYAKSEALLCVGFPRQHSPGTRNCLALARLLGIRTEKFEIEAEPVP